LEGAGNQIDDQNQQNSAKPPGMIHIEEAKEVEHFVKSDPVPLDIF
jgi:hypothetical protein